MTVEPARGPHFALTSHYTVNVSRPPHFPPFPPIVQTKCAPQLLVYKLPLSGKWVKSLLAIICDKNSFSYKMISVNDLKTDSENDYEKVMPSIPSPEPAISCFDDLDFFEDFENEFPAIVYNDAQTSKSDLLTEPILNHQHIDEFDDETSLPEYDEEEQNVLYFNDLFPFNIIRSDDLKSEKDNDNNEIDIIQSFEDNKITHGSTTLFETSHDKSTKNFRTGNFVINLNVKIVIWIFYANGMLFYLIMNLCAPFGVPFDPKRYYKDGDCTIMLQRPRDTDFFGTRD
ncbi:hypothetical protein Tco_1185413 [Tanacetum coccineum]